MDLQLGEEHFVHADIVVLSGVHEDRLHPGRGVQGVHDRTDLHEIRARACDAHDLAHGSVGSSADRRGLCGKAGCPRNPRRIVRAQPVRPQASLGSFSRAV